MIKINLLKNIDSIPTGETKVGEGVVYGEVKKANISGLVLKLVMVIAFPYGLHQYEVINLSDVEKETVIEQAELRKIDKEIQELGAAVEIMKGYKEKQRVFTDQLKVIAELSKSRLDEVFALDNLQSLVPDRLWLTDLKVVDTNMTIKGIAITETDITNLIQNLEESVFFNNVVFTSTVERKTDEGVLQEFEVNCTVESI